MNHQPDLLSWAPARGKTDTSRDAADSMLASADTLRGMCLREIKGSLGLTADECAAGLGMSVLSIRPRFTELRVAGKIADAGIRRMNASGRRAIVWVAR